MGFVSKLPGIIVKSRQGEDGHHLFFQVALCSNENCGNTLEIPNNKSAPLPRVVVHKKMRQAGWSPRKNGRHVCPECLAAKAAAKPHHEETTVKDLPEAAPQKRERTFDTAGYIQSMVPYFDTHIALGEALGLSGSAIGKYLSDGICPRTSALAAKCWLYENGMLLLPTPETTSEHPEPVSYLDGDEDDRVLLVTAPKEAEISMAVNVLQAVKIEATPVMHPSLVLRVTDEEADTALGVLKAMGYRYDGEDL